MRFKMQLAVIYLVFGFVSSGIALQLNHPSVLVSQQGSDSNKSTSHNVRLSDSKCSDRYYSDCHTHLPFESLNVDFDLCFAVCQSYRHPGARDSCDWFIYNEQAYNKCQMFSDTYGTMEDFFNTCTGVGGPTRHEDGTCMVENASPEECSTYCEEDGCRSCDSDTLICEMIHDIDCTQGDGLPAAEPKGVTSFEVCKMACAFLHHPYARWESNSLHPCTCWTTGERRCKKMAVSSSLTREDIDACHNDNGDLGLVFDFIDWTDNTEVHKLSTFPHRTCELPNSSSQLGQGWFHSLSVLTSEDGSPSTLVACSNRECVSWKKGESDWQPYAEFEGDRRGHMTHTVGERLLVIGGWREDESTSTTGVELPGGRIFRLGDPAWPDHLRGTTQFTDESCLISNGDTFVLVGLRNPLVGSGDWAFYEEYSSSGEFIRQLSPPSNNAPSIQACGTFQDDQKETAFLIVTKTLAGLATAVLNNGATNWVPGPELPRNDGVFFHGINLSLDRLILAFQPDHHTTEVFQLSPDGKRWMALGSIEIETPISSFVAAPTNISLLCQ